MPVWTKPGHRTGDADRGPGGAEVLEQALGDGDHGMLRRRVRPEARGRAQSGDRGRVDHVALALFEQHGHEGVDAVDHAPEVDPEDPAPLLLGDLPDRSAHTHPGVVVDEVGAAEPGARCGRAGRVPRRRRRRRSPRPGPRLRLRRSLAPSPRAPAPRYRPAPASCPRRRRAHATALPMPLAPPVITATLPLQVLHVPSVDPAPGAVKHERIGSDRRTAEGSRST